LPGTNTTALMGLFVGEKEKKVFVRLVPVWFLAISLQLGGPEFRLGEGPGRVGHGLVGPRSERSEPVHV
jgi:hypothetical protein